MISPEELWARSYTQFVAIRSGDERLRTSLNALRHKYPREMTSGAVYFPVQWDDDDFETIDLAVEGVFRRMGWIT